jgi:hypothetical protein
MCVCEGERWRERDAFGNYSKLLQSEECSAEWGVDESNSNPRRHGRPWLKCNLIKALACKKNSSNIICSFDSLLFGFVKVDHYQNSGFKRPRQELNMASSERFKVAQNTKVMTLNESGERIKECDRSQGFYRNKTALPPRWHRRRSKTTNQPKRPPDVSLQTFHVPISPENRAITFELHSSERFPFFFTLNKQKINPSLPPPEKKMKAMRETSLPHKDIYQRAHLHLDWRSAAISTHGHR